MRSDQIKMLEDTLEIFQKGQYQKAGNTIHTKLSREAAERCYVYLPEDLQAIRKQIDWNPIHRMGRLGISCQNMDSFSMACEQYARYAPFCKRKDHTILVLNFANPVHPGGGVRRGAVAQEENLCRKSSLLFSLESEQAQTYYHYNRSLRTYLGSDALILTPDVEIIRNQNGELLEESIVVSVLTCAAPMITCGIEDLSEKQYERLFYRRICAILTCAAYLGYPMLVLGAFGCGAFGNDAKLVSNLFDRALKEFDYGGMKAEDVFDRVDFAVLDRSRSLYNFKEFSRNFIDFYREEKSVKQSCAGSIQKEENCEGIVQNEERCGETVQQERRHIGTVQQERVRKRDRIRGSLWGGAAGDALGYAVEFLDVGTILARYGTEGITAYDRDTRTGKALLSDDTQMTLFTANALLVGDTRSCMRGSQKLPREYAALAYQDWLFTQTCEFQEPGRTREKRAPRISWLCDVPELYARRAPGYTCLSALMEAKNGNLVRDYIKYPGNESKGCGGVMRVAPVALREQMDIEQMDWEAAQIAAITHGHSLGYMPAAVLCHIINRIIFPGELRRNLKEIVLEAKETIAKLFAGDSHLEELMQLIDRAIRLSENDAADLDNIKKLGEGWVAEETLAIAIYCSLKYADDFSKGIIAAVNHSGDSDSTGAVTGNILGALIGYEAIADQWKENLECAEVLLEMADDLCDGCQMKADRGYYDADWERKYVQMRYEGRDENSIRKFDGE